MCKQLALYLIVDILNDVTANKRALDAVQTTELTATTSWSTVLPQKVTLPHLVKKFPVFYGTRMIIISFTRTRQLSLSCDWTYHTVCIPNVIPRVPETRRALASPQPDIRILFCTYVRVCFVLSPDILYVYLRTSCLSDDARRK